MTLSEALRAKRKEITDMNYRIQTWGVYDEQSTVVFWPGWRASAQNLERLLDFRNSTDKLVLALPRNSDEETLLLICQLQSIDGLTLYDEIEPAALQLQNCRLAFENTAVPSTEEIRKRSDHL